MKFHAFAFKLWLLACVTLLAGGCQQTPEREESTSGAAVSNEPVRGNIVKPCDLSLAAVPAGAVVALYLDKDGNFLGDYKNDQGEVIAHGGEDLMVTQDNQMCPIPPPNDPGSCPGGYCMKLVPGTTRKICMPC